MAKSRVERAASPPPYVMDALATPLISLRSVSKVFAGDELESHALNGVRLDVHAGEYLAISGPSGAGKTTLVNALLDRHPDLKVSVSHTTRPQRPGEVDGADYFFVDLSRFERMIDDGAFLEHAEVFGHNYGTAARAVADQLDSQHDVILEIDWQGAQQIRTVFPDAVTVFILPPSRTTLLSRLRAPHVCHRLATSATLMAAMPRPSLSGRSPADRLRATPMVQAAAHHSMRRRLASCWLPVASSCTSLTQTITGSEP